MSDKWKHDHWHGSPEKCDPQELKHLTEFEKVEKIVDMLVGVGQMSTAMTFLLRLVESLFYKIQEDREFVKKIADDIL